MCSTGLIKDVNDFARDYMPPHVDLFESEHNRKIKWDHLLRQTSDWQGTLWGKPDWADRPVARTPEDWANRKLWEPGTHFKYNDVRVNVHGARGAAGVAQVAARRAPRGSDGSDRRIVDVALVRLRQLVGRGRRQESAVGERRRPLGRRHVHQLRTTWRASATCSCATASGRTARSSRREWIQMARTPGSDNDTYGYANWSLNTGRKPLPSAPETAVRFIGERIQHHLHRLGERYRGRLPLDRRRWDE